MGLASIEDPNITAKLYLDMVIEFGGVLVEF